MTTGQAQFDAVYQELILGRQFVEYRDYYVQSRQRYRQIIEVIGGLGLAAGARHLDVGGGQMALLAGRMFGLSPHVGDVVETAAADVVAQGVGFQRLNLMDDTYPVDQRYDLVTLLEVIEHIPTPPYVTLQKVATLLNPGGWVVMTTPNGFRIRNILRMLTNREVLDIYRYPEGDQGLGHQHEYTLRQLQWQLGRAGFTDVDVRTYMSGWRGASAQARLAHAVTLPFSLFPHLRDGLLATARLPTDG